MPSLRKLVVTAGAVCAAACVPHLAGYMVLPITTEDRAGRSDAIVELDLTQLAPRFEAFDPQRTGFYVRGRDPLDYSLVDRNDDGRAEVAVVRMSVEPGAGTDLVVVCPDPAAAPDQASTRPSDAATDGIVPRYDRMRR